jgi:hypothetical protein
MLSDKQESSNLEALAETLRNLKQEDFQRVMELVEQSPQPRNGNPQVEEGTPKCPHCSSHHVHRNGFAKGGKQRYICNDCHRTFGQTTGSVRYKSKHSKETCVFDTVEIPKMIIGNSLV